MARPKSPSSPVQAHLKRLWIHGFLAGFGVVVAILLIWFLIWGWPSISGKGQEEAKLAPYQASTLPVAPPAASPVLPPSPQAAAKPPSALEAQLAAVLAKLGEANQKKDLHQLLSLYSPAFPDLPHKAQEISRSWKSFDYLGLRFKLAEISSQGPDSASARVTWEIKTRQRQTGAIKDSTKTFLVQFSRDSGQWRIKSLEKVGKLGERDKAS